MTSVSDLRAGLQHKVGESGPMLALVGAADLAAARLKSVAAHAPSLDAEGQKQVRDAVVAQVQQQVDHGLAFFQTVASRAATLDPAVLRAKLEPAKLREEVGHAQAKALSTAVTTALTTAGRVEQQLGRLVERGKAVVGVVVEQPAEQVLGKAKVTVTRARRVVTGRLATEDGVADLTANGAASPSVAEVAPVVTLAPAGARPVVDKPAVKRVAKVAAKAPAKAAKTTPTSTTTSKTATAKTATAKPAASKTAAKTARTTARPSAAAPSPTVRSRARKTVAKAPVDAVTPLDVAQAVDPAATTPIEESGQG